MILYVATAPENIPLLSSDTVADSVDYKRRVSVRSSSGGWKSGGFILVAVMMERFSYYGISANLLSYFTGELGQSTAVAAANLNAWYGVSQLVPILGAFLADSFVGRYRIIILASLLYILGIGFLSLSAALTSSTNSRSIDTQRVPTSSDHDQLPAIIFFVSLYVAAFAQGGHYPCLQAFGANQFDEENEKECRAKSSFFNWYNYFLCAGGTFALLILNYIQENMSWVLGFGISSIVMCISLIIFFTGTMTYRFRISNDGGKNPFSKIIRVYVKSVRNRRVTPIHVHEELESMPKMNQQVTQFKFLDKALLAPDGTMAIDGVCSVNDVVEAKAIIRLIPIWVTSLGYAITFAQPPTLFTKQASTMDRHIVAGLQIPAASLMLCTNFSIMVFIPIYDRVFVPIARKISHNSSGISVLQRMGIGFLLSIISLVVAATIERKRLATAAEFGLVDNPMATIPISVWWLAPQYLIAGLSIVFSLVGLQEFFYDQVPFELKSVGIALNLSILGMGSLLSSSLVSVVEKVTSTRDGNDGWFSNNLNKAHLDYFYWLLAGISTFGCAAFVLFARSYVYYQRTGN